MFDRLIDLVLNLIDGVKPFVVLRDYQDGVLLRFGRYRRTLGPGFHLVIPFADHVEAVPTVWTTLSLPPQSITTRDGVDVVVKGMVKSRISDAKTYTLEAYDTQDAISDTACGIIYETIRSRTFNECHVGDLPADVIKTLRAEGRKWGISVKAFTLTDFSRMRSIRLVSGSADVG